MASALKKLAGQTAIYGLSSIVGRFLNYLLTPLWTGVFSKEQFGIITEMYAYVAFLVVFLTYGMETTFFRFVNKKDSEKQTVFSTIFISVVSSSALFIGMSLAFAQPIADWLMYPNHKEYVVWFAIIVGLDAVSSIPMAKLRNDNRPKLFAGINLINIFVNIGLNLFFLNYCKGNYDAGTTNEIIDFFYNPEIGVGYVFIANLIASIIKFACLLPSSLKGGFLSFDRHLYRRLARYTAPLLFVGLAGIINETLDRILLKRILIHDYSLKETLGMLGIYGANYKLSIIITLFIQAFRYAAEPFFFNQSNQKGSTKMYADVMNYFIIVVSIIFIGVMGYIDVLKYFINNEELWVGLDIVPILLLANIFLGIYYNLSIWYKLSEKTGFGAIISIIGALATIVLNILLIPVLGYHGSAWATLVCYALMVFISYKWGKKHYPIPYDLNKAFMYLGVSVFIVCALGWFKPDNPGLLYYTFIAILLCTYTAFILKKERIKISRFFPDKK